MTDEGEATTPVKHTTPSKPQLEEALWKNVTTGKVKELKEYLVEHKDHPHLASVLNAPCEIYDEDGGHLLTQCVRTGKVKGSSRGRDYAGCMEVLVEYGVHTDITDKSKKTALSWAVTLKCTSFLTKLMKLGADATVYDHDGFSPFHLCILRGQKDLAACILEYSPQVANHRDSKGVPPLVIAVKYGQSDMCRLLLEKGADINAAEDRTKRTPVYHAIRNKNIDILDILLKHKPHLDTIDCEGRSILFLVCELSDTRFFHKIHSHCTQFSQKIMDHPAEDDQTSVIVACKNGNSEQLKHLLEKGATIKATDTQGKTALHHCADNLETQCAEMLLNKDITIMECKDEQGYTVFTLAVLVGNTNLMKLLIDKGADIHTQDNEGHRLAHWAAVCGHLKVLDLLIQNKADMSEPDFHHAYPIHYAAQMNGSNSGNEDPRISEKVLKKILECKVQLDVVDDAGRQPLLWAACSGNAESCKLLLKAGADINSTDKDNLTALHCAASRGHDQCIEVLRKNGADVNLMDNNKCTPLFYAITLGNMSCTKALVTAKADVNHVDDRGRNPAHCAAIKGCLDTVKLLEKQKADLWFQNHKGDYPVHEAALKGHIDVVKHLIRQKNDKEAVNVTNNLGKTLLHIAAATNNLPLCKLLLNQDCNKNALMKHAGKEFTPYDIAVIKKYDETAKYLKEKGSQPYADLSNAEKRDAKKKPTVKPATADAKAQEKEPKDTEKKKAPAKESKKEKGGKSTDKKEEPKVVPVPVVTKKEKDQKKSEDTKEEKGKKGETEEKIVEKPTKGKKSPTKEETIKEEEPAEVAETVTTVNAGPVKEEQNTEQTKDTKEKSKDKKEKDKKAKDKKVLPKKPSADSVLEKEDGIRTSPVSDELYDESPVSLNETPTEGRDRVKSPMGNKQGKEKKEEGKYVTLEKIEPKEPERTGQASRSDGRKSSKVGFNKVDNEDSGNESDPGRSKSRRTIRSMGSKKPYLDSVKKSVLSYQTTRNTSRSLQQLKRAQIHTGPMHDIVMFSKMMDNYRRGLMGEEEEMDIRNYANWDGYLNDQLRFVSHLYNDDSHTPRELQDIAKEHHKMLETEASKSKQDTDTRCDSIEKEQEFQRKRNQDMDKEIDNLAARTAEMFDSIKSDASVSATSAKERNERLKEEMRRSREEKIRNSTDPREREMLERQQIEDDLEEHHAEIEFERKERLRNWHRRKNEDMRKRLLSAYRPVFPQDVFTKKSVCISGGRVKSAGRLRVDASPTPRPRRSALPSPRPASHKSESSSAAQFRSNQGKTQVQMTPYGLRRVRNQKRPSYDEVEAELADSIFFNANPRTKSADLAANWSRKYDGNIRPRTGLVFVEPHLYDDLMQEEKVAKQRISTEVRTHLTNGQELPNGETDSLLS